MTKMKKDNGSHRQDAVLKAIIGKRAEQQDCAKQSSVILGNGREALLMIVADGMGGEIGGQVASTAAVEAFSSRFSADRTKSKTDRLQAALHSANAAIAKEIERDSRLNGMGCTLVAVIVDGSRIDWISVGDSLLLSANAGGLERLNEDHSMGGSLDRSASRGEITHEEAAASNKRHMLHSALTGGEIAMIDVGATSVKPGTLLIAATDGILSLPYATIARLAGEAQNAEAAATAILDAVSSDMPPDQDNLTLAAILVKGGTAYVSSPTQQYRSPWVIALLALGVLLFLGAGIALVVALFQPEEKLSHPVKPVVKTVTEKTVIKQPSAADADQKTQPIRKEKVIQLPSLNPKPVKKAVPKAEKPKPTPKSPAPTTPKLEPTPKPVDIRPAPAPTMKPDVAPPAATKLPTHDAPPGPTSEHSKQHGGKTP